MKTAIDKFVKSHKLTCATRSQAEANCTCGFVDVMDENEAFKEFVAKVAKMRTAQTNYFRNRLPGDLKDSKGWEREVDKMLAYFLEEKPTAAPPQRRLL